MEKRLLSGVCVCEREKETGYVYVRVGGGGAVPRAHKCKRQAPEMPEIQLTYRKKTGCLMGKHKTKGVH